MFKRVSFEGWHEIVPVVAFILTFGVFIYFVARALRMKRERARYMANLPLEGAAEEPAKNGASDE